MKNLLLLFFLSFSTFSFAQDYVFWGTFLQNEIGRANTDGSNVIQVTVENTTRGMVADASTETLYYVEGSFKNLKKVGFDGSNPETLSTLSNPSQLDIDTDQNHLYVSDGGSKAIHRMDLDGSNRVDFITGMQRPSSLQLNLEEEALYFMDRGTNNATFYRSSLSNRDGLSGSDILFEVDSEVVTFDIDFDSKKIYWSDKTVGEILEADLDGENTKTIATATTQIGSVRIDAINKKLFWSDLANDRIMVSDVQNNTSEVFIDGIEGLSQIALKIDRPIVETAPTTDLYWGDYISADLRKLNKDEKDIQVLVSGENTPRGMAIDFLKSKMFWIEATVDELKSSDLDGGNKQTVASFENASSIALDIENEHIYVTEIDQDIVKRIDYDGTGMIDVISAVNDLGGIFLDFGNEKIIWEETVNATNSVFYNANLDGTDQELLFETATTVANFDYDYWNNKIFWSDRTEQAIRSSNIDGSDKKTLVSSFQTVNAVKLDVQNNRIYWTEPTKNRIRTANLDGSNVQTVVNESKGIAGITLGIQNTSSVKNMIPEAFDIFPNPTSDFINLKVEETGKITILGRDGKIQLTQRSQIGQNRINLQNLTPGTYFLILEESDKSKFSKFVKTE